MLTVKILMALIKQFMITINGNNFAPAFNGQVIGKTIIQQ